MKFRHYRPTDARLFACVVCQNDAFVLCPWMFGSATFVVLCASCSRAAQKKWPEVFDMGARP